MLIIRTDVSGMYQELAVGFLLTEEEHEKERKKEKQSKLGQG